MVDPNSPDDQNQVPQHWWETPRPPGYQGPWPPPLAPGWNYGPTFGTFLDPTGSIKTVMPAVPGEFSDQNATATTATTTGGGNTSTGGTGTQDDIYSAPLTKMFGERFSAPPMLDLGGTPGLSYIPPAPQFKFNAPTAEEAANEPGYAFALGEGDRGIQNWAGARGTLFDSSTAKSLSDYNRAAAAQNYNNVWNRAWTTAQGMFNPLFSSWQTLSAAGQHQNDLNYQNAWNEFLNRQNEFYNWQDRVWNKQFGLANA